MLIVCKIEDWRLIAKTIWKEDKDIFLSTKILEMDFYRKRLYVYAKIKNSMFIPISQCKEV